MSFAPTIISTKSATIFPTLCETIYPTHRLPYDTTIMSAVYYSIFSTNDSAYVSAYHPPNIVSIKPTVNTTFWKAYTTTERSTDFTTNSTTE